jgi:hypothetical protein
MESPPQFNDILLYTTAEGKVKIEVLFENETFWLSQKRIAELFGVEIPTVNYHLKEIFKSGELMEDSVIRKFLTTAADNKNYQTQFYNLDAIIAIGGPSVFSQKKHIQSGDFNQNSIG